MPAAASRCRTRSSAGIGRGEQLCARAAQLDQGVALPDGLDALGGDLGSSDRARSRIAVVIAVVGPRRQAVDEAGGRPSGRRSEPLR